MMRKLDDAHTFLVTSSMVSKRHQWLRRVLVLLHVQMCESFQQGSEIDEAAF